MNNRGMTLIEILVVLGLFTIIGSFALPVSLSMVRDSSYHADRASLIAALQHARAESVDDACAGSSCNAGAPHGVSIQPHTYVIFQGPHYASRDAVQDEVIDANPSVGHGGVSEIIFAPSSGDVAAPGEIVLTDASGHASTITVGSEGEIIWSN